MKLRQKINHCKRHRRNKHLKNKAETICTVASKTDYGMMFVVNPLIYEIIRFNNDNVDWIKPSSFVGDNSDFIIAPRDIIDFYNRNETEYLKQWCGIPSIKDYPPSQESIGELSDIPLSQFAQPELYMGKLLGYGVDKTIFTTSPIPPKPSVSIKEI